MAKQRHEDDERSDLANSVLIDDARREVEALEAGAHPTPIPTTLPDSLKGYHVLQEIHRGGQGVVYHAIEKGTQREVAIKLLKEGPLASPADKARFEREIQILTQLEHANIVAVRESGDAPGGQYFVMDYVHGQPLDAYVADDGQSLEDTLRVFAKICEAVNAAHLRGVIHRDLKPSNIRIDPAGEPHILDFGMAKVAASDAEASSMTVAGQFLGSLPWASPEQAAGLPSRIDIRTDVYSLGVVLYQMLTDRFPYEVIGNMRDVLDRIMKADPTRPSTIRRQISNEVETIVLKCLAKEPARRYQSAGELGRDVERYLAGEPIEAKRDSLGYVLKKSLQRHKLSVAVVAAFAVVVVAGFTTALVLWGQAVEQRAAAEMQREQAAANFMLARDAVDQMLTRVAEELKDQPHMEQVRRELLEDALTFYQRFLEQRGDDVSVRAETARAYRRVGEIRNMLGDGAEARDAFRSSVDLLRGLVEESPHVPEYQDDLAVSECLLSGEECLRAAVERLSLLVDQYPDRPGYQHHLAVARGALADHLAQTRRPAEAAEIYHSLVPIYERLTKQAPNSSDYRNALAQALTTYSDALKDTGDYERAGETLRRAVDVRQQLVADFPGVPRYKADLARAYDTFGILLRERGESQQAYDVFGSGIELLLELTEAFPDVPGYQGSLALMHNNLGGAYYDARRYEDAVTQFRAAIAIQEELVDRFPDNTGRRHDLGLGYNNLGAVLDDAGAREEAGRVLERAVDFVEALVRDAPDQRDHRELLVMAYCNLGGQHYEAGRYAEARPYYDAAIAELDALTVAYPDSVMFRYQLATLLWNLGLLQQDAGNLAEAESPLRRSVELWEQLVEQMPSRAPLWHGLYNAHERLAAVYTALDRSADAEPSLRRMLSAADRLPPPVRADPQTQHDLARAHVRLAESADRADQIEQALVEYEGALRFFEELSSERPGDEHHAQDVQTTLFRLALLHDRLGRCDDALADYRNALRFEQQRVERGADADVPVHQLALAHDALASYLAECSDPALRDPAEAVRQAEAAVDLSREQGAIWNTLGMARYRAGNWSGAIEALNRSMELRDGGDAYDWLFLAMAHWRLGDRDAARDWYDRAIDSMADNPSEDERLDELRAEAANLLEEE